MAEELSDTLEMPLVLSCTDAALGRAVPRVVNSDQESHFTRECFTGCFLAAGVRVLMDGRGCFVDNIFTERLWHSVKYKEVYLADYEMPREARQGLDACFRFYNEGRPHQALGYLTPVAVHDESGRLTRLTDSKKAQSSLN